MAKVSARGKGLHGDYTVEAEGVPAENVAAVMASAIEKAHGGSVSTSLTSAAAAEQKTLQGPRIVKKVLAEFRASAEPAMTAEEAITLRAKVPTPEQVEQFILKQPEKKHSHPQVSREFLGRTVRISGDRSPAEKRLFYLLHRRIEEARRRIEKRDRSGKFVKDSAAFGTHREYRWEREGSTTG